MSGIVNMKAFAGKRALTLALCAACVACSAQLSACSSQDDSDDSINSTVTSSVDGIEPVETERPEYSFPSFLKDNAENISVFSNVVYNSFDPAQMNVSVEQQPIEAADCDLSFLNGAYYSYISGGNKGIMDAEGKILLSANYTQIAMVRPDTFLLTNPLGEESYAFIDENGMITTDSGSGRNWFELEEPVAIKVSESNESQAGKYYLEAANGRIINNQYWDYVEPTNLSLASAAAYYAVDGDARYYIVFDKYYNYKLYECSYATVEVSISGEYGSCFILDNEDYSEIRSMINSFGVSDKQKSSPTDKACDYVKFNFADMRSSYTISSDGFCYTETVSDEGANFKYFSIVDPLCFSDIVGWIDSTLSKEYLK